MNRRVPMIAAFLAAAAMYVFALLIAFGGIRLSAGIPLYAFCVPWIAVMLLLWRMRRRFGYLWPGVFLANLAGVFLVGQILLDNTKPALATACEVLYWTTYGMGTALLFRTHKPHHSPVTTDK